MFLIALSMLFMPWSIEVKYESLPCLTANDYVDPVPVYCFER
jgi:hypothetical protein